MAKIVFPLCLTFLRTKNVILFFSWDSVLTVARTASTTFKAASARAPTCNPTLWSNLEGIRIISASRSYLKKKLKFKISDRRSFEYTIYQRWQRFQFPTSNGWLSLSKQIAIFLLLASSNWFSQVWKLLAQHLLYIHFFKGTHFKKICTVTHMA